MGIPVNLDRLQEALELTKGRHPVHTITFKLAADVAHRMNDLRAGGLGYHAALKKAVEIECGEEASTDFKDVVRVALGHYGQLMRAGPVVTKKDVDEVIIVYKRVLRRFYIDSDGMMQCENNGGPQLSDEDYSTVARRAAAILLDEQERLDSQRSAAFNYVSDANIAARVARSSNAASSLRALLEDKFPGVLETQPWRQFRILRLVSERRPRAVV